MENIADFKKWIWEMRSELGQQVDIAKRLAVAFAETDTQLVRHDQVSQLEILRSRISSEVENTERMESAAQTGYTEGTLVNSGFALVFGSLFMKARGRKDPLKFGVQMARSVLSKTAPFDNVLIGIGKEGIPEDVKVIPVSRLARESKRSESDVVASLKRNGYLMMTLQVFTQALDKTKSEILDGSLSLPIKISEMTKRITR